MLADSSNFIACQFHVGWYGVARVCIYTNSATWEMVDTCVFSVQLTVQTEPKTEHTVRI